MKYIEIENNLDNMTVIWVCNVTEPWHSKLNLKKKKNMSLSNVPPLSNQSSNFVELSFENQKKKVYTFCEHCFSSASAPSENVSSNGVSPRTWFVFSLCLVITLNTMKQMQSPTSHTITF